MKVSAVRKANVSRQLFLMMASLWQFNIFFGIKSKQQQVFMLNLQQH